MLIRRRLIFVMSVLNILLPCTAKEQISATALEGIDDLAAQERAFRRLCESQFPNNKSLEAMTSENGGQRLRTVLISTWKSGTTFLGQILSANPGSFYNYEPLSNFGVVRVRDEPLASEAIQRIKSLLNRDLSKVPTTNKCQPFPSQVIKSVRMSLEVARRMLEDESLKVRLIYLVRDPRAVLQSRRSLRWCQNQIDCSDAATLCRDLEADYKTAKELTLKYPQRFMVARFEEVALDPENQTKEILKFCGLPFNYFVAIYLKSHTKRTQRYPGSTFKDSQSAAFHWKSVMTYNQTQTIQESCSKAMSMWGYKAVNSEAEKDTNFNPLIPFSI